jgi:DNA mismatch repair protein MutS
MVALKASLLKLPELNYLLSKTTSPLLSEMNKNFDLMEDIAGLLDMSISDDAPISLKDGYVIKGGYNQELDELRLLTKNGKEWILSAEAEERERTGIKTLKIGYNKVFGYYIEVTKLNAEMVPDYYIRKQTLVNAERYITPQLKEMENKVLSASEQFIALEGQLFEEIRGKVVAEIDRLKKVCEIIATVDAIASLSQVAFKNGYVMPEVTAGGELIIKDGRHPVVEKMLKNADYYRFNILGLALCGCRIPLTRKRYYFCSQFVSHILETANVIELPHRPSLMRPSDYTKIEDLECVFEGKLNELKEHLNTYEKIIA